MVTQQTLLKILPSAGPQAGVFAPLLNTAMQRFQIIGSRREAAFIAQIGHESGQLRQVLEALSYKAARIIEIGSAAKPGSRWRSLVPRAADLAGSSARLGNALYGGRLGNGPEDSGDGFAFRGRGLIQVTGRTNYLACSMALFGDDRLVRNPELLEQPQFAALSAAWFWSINSLNTLADAGDIKNIGSIINFGQKGQVPNGAADREALYAIALKVLA